MLYPQNLVVELKRPIDAPELERFRTRLNFERDTALRSRGFFGRKTWARVTIKCASTLAPLPILSIFTSAPIILPLLIHEGGRQYALQFQAAIVKSSTILQLSGEGSSREGRLRVMANLLEMADIDDALNETKRLCKLNSKDRVFQGWRKDWEDVREYKDASKSGA